MRRLSQRDFIKMPGPVGGSLGLGQLLVGRTGIWTAAVAVMLAGCTLGERPPSEQVCTFIGCGLSLEVALVGEHVPTDFALTVNSPAGDIVNVHCAEGNAEFDPPSAARWTPACPAGGVTFQGFTPEQLTATVRWSEGEVTQDFELRYDEHRPNGRQCEPTCRSTRVEVRIPEVPAYGDASTWETYSDEEHGFRVKYPRALQLEPGLSADGYRVVFVGDQIRIQTSPGDSLACEGECPMIESTEPVTIGGRDARQVRGHISSNGGNVPQYFMMYLFRLGDVYLSFALYAESRHATTYDPSIIRPLKEEDIELFERIMQTLEFGK